MAFTPPKWNPLSLPTKNIKLLGTKLDTSCDILARKAKVWNPIKKCQKYFRSKRLSVGHKVRVFKTYIEPILLYNLETWTLTSNHEKLLDAFQRRLLRIAINCTYPKIIPNDKLYTLTKEVPISDKVRKRRLVLFGHILRLHPDTPAQKALDYFFTPYKRPVGRPHHTWIAQITKDLENTLTHHKIKVPLTKDSLQRLKILAENRFLWREEVMRSKDRNI